MTQLEAIATLEAEVARLKQERDALAAACAELQSIYRECDREMVKAGLSKRADSTDYAERAMEILAERDGRMKRLGAAEWCDAQAARFRKKAKAMMPSCEGSADCTAEAQWLEACAADLRRAPADQETREARDARMKRIGAAEWCEAQAKHLRQLVRIMSPSEEYLRAVRDEDADWLEDCAFDLRREGEQL